jgi:Rrf2 family protein
MVYSKTCEYAIRALIYFADHPEASSATVKDVSKDSGVPAAYVAKIFQCLAKSRILGSQRGPTGGYSLLIPVDRLTLLKIVQSLDDLSKSPFSNCVMGYDKCNDKNPCPLHPIWVKAKDQMLEKLRSSTVFDMAILGARFRYRKQSRCVLSKRMRNIFSI